MLKFLPYMVAAWLLLVGLYGIVTSRNLVHAITCLSVAQSSTYILLLALAVQAHKHHGTLDPEQFGKERD